MKRVVVTLVILVAACCVLVFVWYPAELAWIMITGGQYNCSWDEALASHQDEMARVVELRRLGERARIVRSEGEMDLWETVDGPLWIPQSNPFPKSGFRGVRWAAVSKMAEPPVRPGDVVIDCGGHWGNSALTALELGAKLVVSFEPDPTNVECIRRNLRSHIEAGRAIVYDAGVWDREGELQFERHGHSAAGHIDPDGTIRVKVTTIDKVVAELGLDRVDLIKMDIEGAEPEALEGARETIRRFKPRLAVGSYHEAGHYRVIPEIVQGIRPDYTMQCLRCLPARGMITPHLYYFY
jgi:FkbM family methyltransferase